ncbi:hypothetical protein IAT38_002007 [Cryptococcus sp. DSM 104549]
MSSRILLLDGGMGTTLEAQGHDVSSSLWGSELLYTTPSIIRGVHSSYLDAGADLIETATYQLTPENLAQHLHCSDEDATRILQAGVSVAGEAISSVLRGKIVLSFGPYGSTLRPGQEYAGIYPPPFGPSSSSNAFPSSSLAEEDAITALSGFHLSKLLAFARDEATWRAVEWVAFETVPVLHEVKAIRRAMGTLDELLREMYGEDAGKRGEDGRNWWNKRFWVTSPFPSGEHPQLKADGGHAGVPEVLSALFDESHPGWLVPDGVGINCTNPKHLSSLAHSFTSSLPHIQRRPWLVFYPDGGQVYDTTTRTWTVAEGGPKGAQEWAKGLYDLAKEMSEVEQGGEQAWAGVIVGGCCKSSFEEISALRKLIDDDKSSS